jgi:hypothetical protein
MTKGATRSPRRFGFRHSGLIRHSSFGFRHYLVLFVVTPRILSLDMNYQPQIEKQKRRGKKQTVQKIERAADSRQQSP